MNGALGAQLDAVTPPRVERRARPRIACSLPLRLTLDGHTVGATMVDLTEHGLRCRVDGQMIVVGRSGSVVFALDGFLVTVPVQVVSALMHDGGCLVGVRFDYVSESAATAIRRYVDHPH